MRHTMKWVFIGFFLVILSSAESVHAVEGDEMWDGSFYSKGLNGIVYSAVVDQHGQIIVGGTFTMGDDVAVHHVAGYYGGVWHSLGSGLNGTVLCLALDADGLLYAGGKFTDAGDDPEADHIAVWDGSHWDALARNNSRLNDDVYTIVPASGGVIYAGGDFFNAGGDSDADFIAVWGGLAWHSLGGPGSGLNYPVRTIALSSSGMLYAGGLFDDAGGVAAADHVAQWNGSAWRAVGGGLNGRVSALALDSSDTLYAGGLFTDAGGDADADHIAVLGSTHWESIGGSGSGTNGVVYALVFDERDNLHIAGNFSNAGGDSVADGIAIWSSGSWTALGHPEGGVHLGCPHTMVFDNDGRLIAGGSFKSAGVNTPYTRNIAAWNRNTWEAMTDSTLDEGGGLSDEVRALGFDAHGYLIAGGYFQNASDNEDADYIALWDGNSWNPLGDADHNIDSYVNAIITNSAGQPVAGGEFLDAGGDPDADFIAFWDGWSWKSLNGAGSGLNGYVSALALSPDGLIYAGGDFNDAGGDPDADYLAVWDGVTWSAVGGSSSVVDDIVYDLSFDPDGMLYIVGEFYGVATWDGTDMALINGSATALNDRAYAVTVDSLGRVYVGGDSFDAGTNPTDNILMWDGSAWTSLGNGLNSFVWDLVVDGHDRVYATGEFSPTVSEPSMKSYIAVWDGTGWNDLGSGIDYYGYALAWDGRENLYVGGDFDFAGGKPSLNIGIYRGAAPQALFFDGFETGNTSRWDATSQ